MTPFIMNLWVHDVLGKVKTPKMAKTKRGTLQKGQFAEITRMYYSTIENMKNRRTLGRFFYKHAASTTDSFPFTRTGLVLYLFSFTLHQIIPKYVHSGICLRRSVDILPRSAYSVLVDRIIKNVLRVSLSNISRNNDYNSKADVQNVFPTVRYNYGIATI